MTEAAGEEYQGLDPDDPTLVLRRYIPKSVYARPGLSSTATEDIQIIPEW